MDLRKRPARVAGTARVRSLAGGEWNVCLNLGADDPPTCSCGVPKVER